MNKHDSRRWPGAGGFSAIFTLGMTVIGLCLGALAVDMGLYFTAQNQLQTAADAGALAGANAIIQSTSAAGRASYSEQEAIELAEENLPFTQVNSGNVEVGYYDFNDHSFSAGPAPGEIPLTGGYNAVTVEAWTDESHGGTPVPAILAQLFGINDLESGARSVAAFTNEVAEVQGGLRPIYGCQAQWNLAASDGNLSNNVIRIYGDRFMLDGSTVSCPLPGPGNWGFADFRDCSPGSPGTSTMSDWFAGGYPGPVYTGRCYSTAPGNFIGSNGVHTTLTRLRDEATVITIPLIDNFQGGGSNTQVDIVSFTGFVITGFVANGNANNRYIQGYFTPATCSSRCVAGNADGGGLLKLRLVQDSSG